MVYTYEEALEASIAYFDGDELAGKVFVDKYALRDNEGNILEQTPVDMHKRIAKEFARIEKKKFKDTGMEPLTEEFIFDLLDKFKYIVPQGGPMAGIGNPYQFVSLSNCYVLTSPLDDYGSIMMTDFELVNISKRRGGIGISLSNLRPAGTPTKNAARTSTGIIPFMERYSNSTREVGQNSRRGASILTLDINHPEVMNFINVKNDPLKVTGANISVKINDEFINAVRNDQDYELMWPIDSREKGVEPKISKVVSAKTIWDAIISSAHNRAEPGIINWSNVLKYGPADIYDKYRSVNVNPCSELTLNELDSCRLMLLNLYSFVDNPFTKDAKFNYDKFFTYASYLQRLMDDMVELESEKLSLILNKLKNDPEKNEAKQFEINMWKKIKHFNDNGRRTGSGITGLGDTIAALGIKYGSDASIEVVEQIYRTLKLGCYRMSVDLAKEFGSFDVYDAKLEKGHPYISRIEEDDSKLYKDMVKYGRRNVSLTTTAPAGSVSILTQTTSGIEPVFMSSYIRRKKINHDDKNAQVDFVDAKGDKWQNFTIYHPKVKEWMDITGETDLKKSPWHNASANDINWLNRVKMQAAAQRHTCHSISSTVNVPNDTTKETIGEIYQAAVDYGCKGITVYRDGCRDGVLISKDTETKIPTERPTEVPCDVFHIKVRHKDDGEWISNEYFVLVGILDGKPYEVFSGKNGSIPEEIQHGKIIKVQRHYKIKFDNNDVVNNISTLVDDTEEGITRLISLSLQNGVSIHSVVKQLEKVTGKDMQSFAKSLTRALKTYIPNGTPEKEKCPMCEIELIREEGCVICKGCGWSKCS